MCTGLHNIENTSGSGGKHKLFMFRQKRGGQPQQDVVEYVHTLIGPFLLANAVGHPPIIFRRIKYEKKIRI